uniref:Band 7 domain-containing protein n=1 Tax=Oscillatoriales cyanobacterium SpSt-402 TaxID=2282168 RepID=A0A832H574_9CYAN
MDTLIIILGGIILVIVVIVAIVIFAKTTQVVPQEKRLVIYRFGRFHRIAGPGPVRIVPGLDEVVQTIEVRDHPVEITIPGIFVFGVPNDFTLNLWYRVDLVQAAESDNNKLAELVQIRDEERSRQIQVIIREALSNQVANIQKRMPLPEGATTLDGVIALALGNERSQELMKSVKQELERTLPSVGVVLNATRPITLTQRGIPGEIIKAIQRQQGREIDSQWLIKYAAVLQREFPEISKAVSSQVLAAIEGVDVGKIQRLLLEQEAGAGGEFEVEMSERDGTIPRVRAKTKTKVDKPYAHREPESGRSQQAVRPRLTEDDLAVLKCVPRAN